MNQLDLIPGSEPTPKPTENWQSPSALALAGVLGGSDGLTRATTLLSRFGSLRGVCGAMEAELSQVLTPRQVRAVLAACQFQLETSREIRHESPLLDNPASIADLLREENQSYRVECFQVVLLNTRRRLIKAEVVSQGILDTLLVHPREVFKSAIAYGAAAVALVHNHPSGDPTPSEADIRVTRDLIRAGQLLKIEVVDHIILGARTTDRSRDYVSLRELGYFSF